MIVITGATGHTGKPAAEALLAKGEKVRVIGRDAKKLEPLVQKGAEAFVGNVEDAASMTKAFEGADAVYLVLPKTSRNGFSRLSGTRDGFLRRRSRECATCHMSSPSAASARNTRKRPAPSSVCTTMEQKLNRIAGLNVLHLRPAYFMENLLMSIPPMRTMGFFPAALAGDMPMPWIATKDIGEYAAKRLAARDFSGSSTQELHGQRDISMKEAAPIVGSVDRQAQTRIHAGAVHDARASARSDGNAEKNRGAAD